MPKFEKWTKSRVQALGRMKSGSMNKTEAAYAMHLEAHEVKGHWEDDARVKIKVAAEKFPFRFVAVKKGPSGWEFEDF